MKSYSFFYGIVLAKEGVSVSKGQEDASSLGLKWPEADLSLKLEKMINFLSSSYVVSTL